MSEAGMCLQDKEALEVRMAEYGAGLVKLKEASFQDAAARRDGQRALQAAHAELKGSALREQARGLCLMLHVPRLPLCSSSI